MAARQFSSHQEFYPARGGGTLGADRKAATALVYQDVVAGVASTVAIQGDDGSIIAIQATALNTDNVIFNAATVYVAALGGGMIYVEEADYNLAATWNVSIDIFVQGAGWDAILNYNAGGNCITVTGDNVKIRDLKIVIVAGAGGAGTRPNGILADTRTNVEIFGVWFIGDQTVADDGSNARQMGIIFDTVTHSKILNNRIEEAGRHGLIGSTITQNIISKNIILSVLQEGLRLDADSQFNEISLNIMEDNEQEGIRINNSQFNIISDNISRTNTRNGIRASGTSENNTYVSNRTSGNTLSGIRLQSTNKNIVIGNYCISNVQHGLLVDSSDDNLIIGNYCNDNDSGTTNSYDGINLTTDSDTNLIFNNICQDNDRYGINILITCDNNWVRNNQLQRNTTAPFNDAAAGTKLTTYSMPFIQGSTLISATGNPWGWKIDLAGEFAVTWGWLPLEVQQVIRIRVIAVGLAAPGAGNAMRLELTGEGATFDEVYTTNSIDVANHDSNETNFAINDVIQWIFTVTDDPQIGTLLGGDRVQFEVLHEVAGNGNIATDAVFSSVEIEYV